MTGTNTGLFFKFQTQVLPLVLFHFYRRFALAPFIPYRKREFFLLHVVQIIQLVLARIPVERDDTVPLFYAQSFGYGISFYLGNFQHTDLLYLFFKNL